MLSAFYPYFNGFFSIADYAVLFKQYEYIFQASFIQFFNTAIEECEEDFQFILRCIHENEHGLPYDEWEEEYGPWVHLTTPEQVAYKYYGREELLLLIPEWHVLF